MVRRRWNPREVALIGAFVIVILSFLTFYVWYQTESVRLGLEIGRAEARIQSLEKDIEALKLRRAALLDLGRVERIARASLGLTDPKDEDIIHEDRERPR